MPMYWLGKVFYMNKLKSSKILLKTYLIKHKKANGEIMQIFDPQLFRHEFPENQEIRDISEERGPNMIVSQEINIRCGVAGILEDANLQMSHGLGANFGVKKVGLSAICESDIDVSDGEALKSSLENARRELRDNTNVVPTTTLRCIAKRKRLTGKNWIRCAMKAVKGDQYCPLHLQVNK